MHATISLGGTLAGEHGIGVSKAAYLPLEQGKELVALQQDIKRAFDPRGLLPMDAGHRDREPEYLGAAGAFATGTPDGLRSWIKHCAEAVQVAAGALSQICDEVS